MTVADPAESPTGLVGMAAADIREAIAEMTCSVMGRAAGRYGVDLSAVQLRFDLRGRAAGMALYVPMQIRYNLVIASLDLEAFLKATVPHEVAHLATYGLYGGKVRPHGGEWQAICRDLGGDGRRCHQYDVPSVRQVRRFLYACGCQTVNLSIVRVNRMRNRHVRYFCKRCNGTFQPVGAES